MRPMLAEDISNIRSGLDVVDRYVSLGDDVPDKMKQQDIMSFVKASLRELRAMDYCLVVTKYIADIMDRTPKYQKVFLRSTSCLIHVLPAQNSAP